MSSSGKRTDCSSGSEQPDRLLVTKNDELDRAEGSAPREEEREAVRVDGKVGVPTTAGVMAPTRKR
jgi:hypothetical protein